MEVWIRRKEAEEREKQKQDEMTFRREKMRVEE